MVEHELKKAGCFSRGTQSGTEPSRSSYMYAGWLSEELFGTFTGKRLPLKVLTLFQKNGTRRRFSFLNMFKGLFQFQNTEMFSLKALWWFVTNDRKQPLVLNEEIYPINKTSLCLNTGSYAVSPFCSVMERVEINNKLEKSMRTNKPSSVCIPAACRPVQITGTQKNSLAEFDSRSFNMYK